MPLYLGIHLFLKSSPVRRRCQALEDISLSPALPRRDGTLDADRQKFSVERFGVDIRPAEKESRQERPAYPLLPVLQLSKSPIRAILPVQDPEPIHPRLVLLAAQYTAAGMRRQD